MRSIPGGGERQVAATTTFGERLPSHDTDQAPLVPCVAAHHRLPASPERGTRLLWGSSAPMPGRRPHAVAPPGRASNRSDGWTHDRCRRARSPHDRAFWSGRDMRSHALPIPHHWPGFAPLIGIANETATAPPPSKSVQPTIASATVNSLISPYFGQFASYGAPENRGVGSSILPLTTGSDSGSYGRHEDPSAALGRLPGALPTPRRIARGHLPDTRTRRRSRTASASRRSGRSARRGRLHRMERCGPGPSPRPSAEQVRFSSAAPAQLIDAILADVVRDEADTLTSDEALTTGQAAQVLGLSRPTLVSWLEAGRIPFGWCGAHRRVRRCDVLAYRDRPQQLDGGTSR
jgi:excisionase family DNA binding protein